MTTSATCAYHPTQSAWWYCNRCQRPLCPQCIVQRKGGFTGTEIHYMCPQCLVPATNLDITNIVEPFWKRLHKCFAYPFSSVSSVVLIFGLALLSSVFRGPGLLAALIRFALWAVMVKYAYEALRATAEARFSPPPLSGRVLGEDLHLVFKQIALFIALFFIFIFFVAKLGPVAWILFGLAVIIGLPSMIIILAINDNLAQALNPVYFIGMAIRIGWGYLLLFFFLSILLSAPGALGYYFIQHLPESLQFFFMSAAKNYYTLVSYHLMGYVILQYHGRLDHQVDMGALLASLYPAGLPQSTQGGTSPTEQHEFALLNEVGHLIQEGRLDEAITEIQTRTRLEIDSLELSQRYVDLLQMQKRIDDMARYAAHHLDLLVKSDEKAKAFDFYLTCNVKHDGFKPLAATLFKIGGWLTEKRRAKEALAAYNLLLKTYPRDSLIPKTYLRGAQLLHEQLMNTEKAKKALQTLIEKYPDHEITAFARNYLGSL